MAASIYLIRHGRTRYNVQHRFQGQIDIPLDPAGLWQAQRTGRALRAILAQGIAPAPASGDVAFDPDGFDPARDLLIVASPLARALQTAHAFADPWDLPVATDPRLRERGFGGWDGVSMDEARAQDPDGFQAWLDGRGGEVLHGAETRESLGARGAAALQDWAGKAEDRTLLVFAHGALIAETVDNLLEPRGTTPRIANLSTMRNGHWAQMATRTTSDGETRWRLLAYNAGPAEAATPRWDDPPVDGAAADDGPEGR